MRKAVRIGDLVFVREGEEFIVSHLYPGASSGKRFRITDNKVSADEVVGFGADPISGSAIPPTLRLHLEAGDGYWCLLVINAKSREPVRSLGKVHDEVIANILNYRTPEGTQFNDISYDQLRQVRKARDEAAYRSRMLAHIEDTRIIRDTLTQMLDVLRLIAERGAPYQQKPKRKTKAKQEPTQEQEEGET